MGGEIGIGDMVVGGRWVLVRSGSRWGGTWGGWGHHCIAAYHYSSTCHDRSLG